MKRFLFLMLLMCFFTAANVYAGDSADSMASGEQTEAEDWPLVDFEILSGFDVEKDFLSTLDSTLTISGRAENGSTITIVLWSKNEDEEGNLIPQAEYMVEVGTVALFSQVVDLKVGENNFTIYVEKPERTGMMLDFLVKRKKQIIKAVLENGVAVPGTVMITPVVLGGLPEVTGE